MAAAAGADGRTAQFADILASWQARVERALDRRLPGPDLVPQRLHAAMRYSVLGGGKRVRPALVFATAHALGLPEDQVEAAACAIELIHVYSLVHDDLPAMDDDDLRRGRPTCHRAFDEPTAILVGDALQPLAFELLAADDTLPAIGAVRAQLVAILAQAAGSLGMAGGQAIDLAAQGTHPDLALVRLMHERKTGALIRASVLMAAACRTDLEPALRTALERFAGAIGLAFQIQDDLLDVSGDPLLLGKAVGADRARGKPTYVTVAGLETARAHLRALHEQAQQALIPFGESAALLRACSGWLLERRH